MLLLSIFYRIIEILSNLNQAVPGWVINYSTSSLEEILSRKSGA
jgi:hypothetical protein